MNFFIDPNSALNAKRRTRGIIDLQFFHRSAAAPVWADDPIRILGKAETQDPEFQKEYLELIDEGPTRVIPNEMEKLVRQLPRDTEIVTLLKESAMNVLLQDPTVQFCNCCPGRRFSA